jgi:hypothetical protein
MQYSQKRLDLTRILVKKRLSLQAEKSRIARHDHRYSEKKGQYRRIHFVYVAIGGHSSRL